MEKNFAYKYFLLLNHIANKMNNHVYLNFAELIHSENNGRFMNSQMTFYFHKADEILSGILCNNPEWIWDELDIEGIALIEPSVLEHDYFRLVEDCDLGFITFKAM